MKKKYKYFFNKTAVFFLLLTSTILFSCNSKNAENDLLLGSWHSKKNNTYTILTFRSNGTWLSEVRIEGGLYKIIIKKGSVTGKWNIDDKRLNMMTIESSLDLGWEKNKNASFEVVELSKTVLRLKTESGKVSEFSRVRKKTKSKDNKDDSGYATIHLKPIIVNLHKERPQYKDKYFSIKPELVLEDLKSDYQLHPKVRETIIFYLSSLSYSDVNSYDKLKKVNKHLQQIIDPYIDGKLVEIIAEDVLITSSKKAIDDFIAKSSEKDKEKDRKNDGK